MSGSGLPSRDEVRRRVVDALSAAALGTGLASNYDDKAKADDFFEAYLLTALLEEAQDTGWDVTIVEAAGRVAPELRLRAGPGSFSSPSQNYTHAVLERTGAFALEAHVGVRVRGDSGVLHEADVLLVPKAVAEACRDDRVAPAVLQIVATFEAKFIDSDVVPLAYGRSAVGLDTDMLEVPYAALVTTRPSASVTRLLERWEIKHVGEILSAPGTINDAALRAYLQELLAWWAGSGRWWQSPHKNRRPRRTRR